MPEQLFKLSPHRDLACYYFQPSAIAALSGASESGLTLSGSWRQQGDWAVVEWNRDNVFEHPALRYLPDGDLSGLTLSYVEQRTNCVPLESNIYPSVEWPYLRLWSRTAAGTEDLYYIKLADPQHSKPAVGSSYQNASAAMILNGSVTPGIRVGLAFMGTFASAVDPTQSQIEQHYYYVPKTGDALADVAAGIASAINAGSQDIQASSNGNVVTCIYRGTGAARDKTGANANRIGVYGFVGFGSGCFWSQSATIFSGGQFPLQYQVTIPFSNLLGYKVDPNNPSAPMVFNQPVPTTNVRKLRWTWAADLQAGAFQRTTFNVSMTQWTVTGNGRQYFVAGPGSRRIEDDDPTVVYSGSWSNEGPGNYSGSRIQKTAEVGDTCTIAYSEAAAHQLYLGTRMLNNGASVQVSIDGSAATTINLQLPGEDELVRLPLGVVQPGSHAVVVRNIGGAANATLYFDFLEIVYPTANLPDFAPQPQLALATDWDTLHSQALPAERTAWMIWKLGFRGRVNYYVGAIWFYELFRPGQQYASVTATVSINPSGSTPKGFTELDFGSGISKTTIQHLNLQDDNAATIAQALALRINQGTTAIWASAVGPTITITARTISEDNNFLAVSNYQDPNGNVSVALSATTLTGQVPGINVGYNPSDQIQALTDYWRTDLTYQPRLNQACRDWSVAFYQVLTSYGMDCVATFSTELAHVDPTAAAGMAQRYYDHSPVILDTPAIQTNFSPTAIAFWEGVYVNMAQLQNVAGMAPYIQSGEVQWWYFPQEKQNGSMPFYDDYTVQQFTARYGTNIQEIYSSAADPTKYPNEASLLPELLGNYTAAIRTALKAAYPTCRYEVLYPGDQNDPQAFPFNAAVNYPTSDWTPANLTCLKTEGLSFTTERNLDASLSCMRISKQKGFPDSQRSHLVQINDTTIPWMKEADLAQAEGVESVVLFALDQYCLIGYPAPPFLMQRWSRRAA